MSGRTPAERLRLLVVVALLLSLGGCANAFYTRSRTSNGQQVVSAPAKILRPGATKLEVLALLGPPADVLALPEGDLFIYSLELVDLDIFALQNPNGISVPVFQYEQGLAQEFSVFCWFDSRGLLVDSSRAIARSSR